jgi:hypothetical protein
MVSPIVPASVVLDQTPRLDNKLDQRKSRVRPEYKSKIVLDNMQNSVISARLSG